MDKSVLTEVMKTSISEVIEQMFFMAIDFITQGKAGVEPQQDNEPIFAKLGFNGASCGTFILGMPLTLAQSVSADFLGTTPQSLVDEQVSGTVLEMVNMLAGTTLAMYDNQALFDLQMPELITLSDVQALTVGGADHIVINIQTLESPMTLQLIFN